MSTPRTASLLLHTGLDKRLERRGERAQERVREAGERQASPCPPANTLLTSTSCRESWSASRDLLVRDVPPSALTSRAQRRYSPTSPAPLSITRARWQQLALSRFPAVSRPAFCFTIACTFGIMSYEPDNYDQRDRSPRRRSRSPRRSRRSYSPRSRSRSRDDYRRSERRSRSPNSGAQGTGGYQSSSYGASRGGPRPVENKDNMMQSIRDSSQQNRRVYVGNLSYDVKWHHLKDFMRQGTTGLRRFAC